MGLLGWAWGAVGQGTNGLPAGGPYFVGYQSEPGMDYGGRTLASLDGLVCRGLGEMIGWQNHTFIAFAYETYLGGFISVVQHEGMGHGGRAREFALDPSYTFGADLSGATSIGKDPESALQNVLLAGGGIEADGVLGQRLLREFYSSAGADAAKVPLMGFAKMDFTLYCLETPDPSDSLDDFQQAYDDGNDVAYYLTARQAHRAGASASDVWNDRYTVRGGDPALEDAYRDLQAAALWNLLDPAFWATTYSYAVDHFGKHQERIQAPSVPLGNGLGIMAGTRAFLGPDYVTSYLDLYLVTPGPLVQAYARTLQSGKDTSLGGGAGVYGWPVLANLAAGAAADVWRAPDSEEKLEEGTGWNVSGEVDTLFARRMGVSVKLGAKSDGYLPGTPMDSGVYGGVGLLFAF